MRSKGHAEIEIDHKAVSKNLGAIIRNARLEKSISQKNLGNMIGTAFQQVQKYENGSTEITIIRLIQICFALEISIDEIIALALASSRNYIKKTTNKKSL